MSQEDSKPREARDWRKPNWWKWSVRSYWLLIVLINAAGIIALTLTALSLQTFSIVKLVGGVVLTIVLLSTAYYIRVKVSITLWRAIWMAAGAFGLWLPTFFIGALLIGRRLTDLVGPGLSLLIVFAVPMVIGAFIGDWVGKRRGYMPLG